MNATTQKIKQVIARVAMIPVAEVADDSSISSLGVTSFDRIECVLALEEVFQVELPQETLETAQTVADFIAAVDKVLLENQAVEKV